MPVIELKTIINSEIEICFDLSRSIDLHKLSTAHTKEIAIDGITSGLINLNEYLTWRATHFGIRQKLTSKITQYNRPSHFRDEQQKGIFRSMIHDHYFEKTNDGIIMTDIFKFESPCGYIGKLFNKIVLIHYLQNLLVSRNKMIKDFAESGKWKTILN